MNLFGSELCKISILIFLSVLGYIYSLDGDFVFDDSEAIIGNAALKDDFPIFKLFAVDFWGTNIKDKNSHKSYRPLTLLTFRFHKYFDGDLVAYNFKFTNLILHSICCCFIYATYKVIFAKAKQNEETKNLDIDKEIIGKNRNVFDETFLAAVLFAVHPIHVEAVSGVVGRADILSGIFFAGAFIIYDRVCHSHHAVSPQKCLQFFLVIVLSMASFICKETGITIFVVCAVYEIVIINRLEPICLLYVLKEFNQKLPDNATNTVIKIPFKLYKYMIFNISILFAATVMFLFVRWSIMDYEGPTFHEIDNPAAFSDDFLTRVLTYNYIYFLNLLLMIWPHWLCFDWSMGCIPLVRNILDYRVIFIFLFIMFAGVVMYFGIFNIRASGYRRRAITMSVILMIVPFLPASNLIMPVGFVVAERVLYIPSSGFCLLVAIGYGTLQTYSERISKVLPIFLLVLVVSFTMKTYHRAREWRTEYTLFNSGLSVCPFNAKIHYNVARNAVDRNDVAFAMDRYKEAIRLNPKYYQAMNNLANLLKDQKQYDKAEKLLKAALDLKEDFPSAWNNLGIVLTSMKRPQEAESAYRNALKYKRNYPDCYYNLGNLYLEEKMHNKALEAWSNATMLNPQHVSAWNNILALLDNTGQIQKGLEIGNIVLQQIPNAASVHFNLGNLFGKSGDFDRAEHHFAAALRLTEPNAPPIYYTNFGVLYHRAKKYEEAKNMYENALKKNPTSTSAMKNLQSVERLLGI